MKNRRAFTLMEMLVALSILIIMMGAIGEIFRIAGNASASGQAMLNVMASVRVAQGQMAQDIGGLNTSGYLAIRQRWFIPVWQQNYQYQVGDEVVNTSSILSSEKNALPSFTFYVCLQPNSAASLNTNNATLWQSYTIATGVSSPANSGATSIAWRADQVAFLANGNFQSRTGDNT
ncbi:MAG TPA: type II secretion system protein, partial [Phycisphaerae bacterium]|nr:type II secretion system protein [Phycisphaerae bacterium]